MAIAPDSGETFVREVDENLRRDQATDFAKRYGGWIAGAILLLLAAAGGYLFWQERQRAAAEGHGEELSQVLTDIGNGNIGTAPARLQKLRDVNSEGYRAAAMLTEAALAVQQNDRKTAIERYAAVAADESLPGAYRDLATIRRTALDFDSAPPQEVINRLAPLAKGESPWFGSAGELTALAMLKLGRQAEAGRLLATIAADRKVPSSIRDRSAQLATTLGIEVPALNPRPAP